MIVTERVEAEREFNESLLTPVVRMLPYCFLLLQSVAIVCVCTYACKRRIVNADEKRLGDPVTKHGENWWANQLTTGRKKGPDRRRFQGKFVKVHLKQQPGTTGMPCITGFRPSIFPTEQKNCLLYFSVVPTRKVFLRLFTCSQSFFFQCLINYFCVDILCPIL